MNELLDTIDIETAPDPQGSIIFMHGLGADAHDFEPIVPQLGELTQRRLRFVFPNAPVRPITVNSGYPMRAWFDIVAFGGNSPPDETGIRASAAAIGALIRRENERAIPTNRIVLGGFSQGGAMAVFTGVRHPERLAGIIGLSCFGLLESTLDAEAQDANRETPVFLGHGTRDPLVELRRGEAQRTLLESRGHPVEWRAYPMEHTVSLEEVQHLAGWLRRVL